MTIVWFISLALVFILFWVAYDKLNKTRERHVVLIIMGLSCNIALWLLCELIIQLSFNPSTILFVHEAKYIAILSIPGMLHAFAINLYTGKSQKRRSITLLIIIPIILLIGIITNPWHHLFRVDLSVDLDIIHIVQTVNGPLYYLVIGFTYIVILYSLILLLRYHRQQPAIYRKRIGYLIAGIFIIFLSNVIYQYLHIQYGLMFDFSPISFGVVAMLLYYAYFIYDHDDVSDIAKSAILSRLSVGILFFDRSNDIFYANDYFAGIVAVPAGELMKKNFDDLPDRIQRALLETSMENQDVLLEMTAYDQIAIYSVQTQQINDEANRLIGTLAYFQNITEERQRIVQLELEQYQSQRTNPRDPSSSK